METRMPAPSNNPQDTAVAIALFIAFAACLCAVYWRTTLKVLMIAALAFAVFSAAFCIDTVISALAAHHP
jgi:hypothetical protein